MGRPEEPLERDGSPVREFAFWLRDLRHRSGLTYDQLGKKAHYATSTVQAATAGHRLPTLRVAMAIVRACDGDAVQWHDYWTRIRRLLDDDVPAGVSRSAEPPWAASAPRPAPVREVPSSIAAAEAVLAAVADSGDGWFIESFSALLRLDADPVEALEFRRVAATVDGLSELVTSVSVPRPPDDAGDAQGLESELLYGGMLERRGQPYDSFFQNVIVLPAPLRAGDRLDYAIRHRIPSGQPMASHYVHVPYRRSDRFALRVRFPADRPPHEVWVLRDAPTAAIYRQAPSAETLVPNRCGEVLVSFAGLRPGLGYGISWR
jgi:DNA-binding XRE family transcriptional regulator